MPIAPGPPFQSKSEYAYAAIKQRILSEELLPGGVISQERVAIELGVSTTPIRESLKRLAAEGLVVLGSHRDARVTDLTVHDARSLHEVRQSLDPLAAHLAAERRSAPDIEAIDAALQVLHPLSEQSAADALIAHREFHRAIYRASGNPLLIDVLEGLWDKADRFRRAGLRLGPRSQAETARVRSEHQELADAVTAGDPDRAENVMADHVRHSLGRRVLDQLEDDQPVAPAT